MYAQVQVDFVAWLLDLSSFWKATTLFLWPSSSNANSWSSSVFRLYHSQAFWIWEWKALYLLRNQKKIRLPPYKTDGSPFLTLKHLSLPLKHLSLPLPTEKHTFFERQGGQRAVLLTSMPLFLGEDCTVLGSPPTPSKYYKSSLYGMWSSM